MFSPYTLQCLEHRDPRARGAHIIMRADLSADPREYKTHPPIAPGPSGRDRLTGATDHPSFIVPGYLA